MSQVECYGETEKKMKMRFSGINHIIEQILKEVVIMARRCVKVLLASDNLLL